MKKYLIALLLALPTSVMAEKSGFRLDNWAVTFDKEKMSSMVYGIEKSDANTTLPQLFLICSQSDKKRKQYRMGLLTQSVLKIDDPNALDVMISIDDKPKMEYPWFQIKHSLQSAVPKMNIKEMINGNELNIQFRDKHQLHRYTYDLKHFKQTLNIMEEVCAYKYDD